MDKGNGHASVLGECMGQRQLQAHRRRYLPPGVGSASSGVRMDQVGMGEDGTKQGTRCVLTVEDFNSAGVIVFAAIAGTQNGRSCSVLWTQAFTVYVPGARQVIHPKSQLVRVSL